MNKKQQEYDEANLVSEWFQKFREAMVAKHPYTSRWKTYENAYSGEYFKNVNLPDYKSNLISNYIFSIIETIRPIMLDQNPKFQAMPRQPDAVEFSNDIQEMLNYEFDREDVMVKMSRELINVLKLGSSVFFIPWDKDRKNTRIINISPYNLFPDPLATSVEDAEYMIYASYKPDYELKRIFPKKAEQIEGGNVKYSELVFDNNKDSRIDNQVLVLEVYAVKKEANNSYDDYEVLTMLPELGILLDRKNLPYDDKKLPFILIKDYDLPGKFWGEGEVAQLLSPQKYMNELNNAIVDNAKATANMPWILDKNSGVPKDSITSRPGLVIRKNPGSEVKREQAPSMPNYVINAVETYKNDMEQISGIFDTVKGNSETGVYTAQGILALQEAGQARIRLKTKLFEYSLGKMATMVFGRAKQFWKEDRWLNVSRVDGEADLKKFNKNSLEFDYDIKITAGSTMPSNRGAMLDLMVRLAQTIMPDGQALVDREAVATYLPDEVRGPLMQRNKENSGQIQQQMQQMGEAMQQLAQQVQQGMEENKQNDEQTMKVVEDLVGAVEKINKEILQLQEKHDKLIQEQKKKEEIEQIKEASYNSGYKDAESMASENFSFSDEDVMPETGVLDEGAMLGEEESLVEGEDDGILDEIPEDVLSGLEEMSDDELALIIEQNPELLEMINMQNQ